MNDYGTSTQGLLDTNPAAAWAIIIFAIAFAIVMIISLWKVFIKAGKPGWAAIVPIYNLIVLVQIGQKPSWWVLVLILGGIIPIVGPLVAIVFQIMLCLAIAKNFGKTPGFGVGLFFLGFIFYPILAFGDAEYNTEENVESSDLLDS